MPPIEAVELAPDVINTPAVTAEPLAPDVLIDVPGITSAGELLVMTPPATRSAPTGQARPVTARSAAPDTAHRTYHLNRLRYIKIVIFFVTLFGRLLIWEIGIRRIMGETFVARGRSKRSRNASRQFRNLAVEMGGVMIKLGQFISSRVDILPPEITDELIGLQDNVPVVPFDYIKKTVERELGPLEARYLWFNPEPVAAASFGQVHRAQLHNGDRVVVKVQRPNLNDVVHTDLSALSVVARLAMYWSLIRKRANMPALLDEFSRVLWEELDYKAEADHALKFASMFADDMGVYIPAIYLEHSSAFVLTIEDVTSIKLNDYAALDRAGISRAEVAERLLDTYMRQIFDFQFFHADPHPGNIFIYPLPEDKDKAASTNGKTNGKSRNRPFYLIFIDFGMVGRLTPLVNDGLRETIIAIVTQDAAGLVRAYQKLGVLLPGADTKRIEEATRMVFDKIWGLNMQEMQSLPYEEMLEVGQQFSDLLLTMPFQMPQDFIYLSRAIGILSGMCTGLDPHFDPWKAIQPFTSKMLSTSSDRTKNALGTNNAALAVVGTFLGVARTYAGRVAHLPTLADSVLTRAERGELSVQMTLDANTRQQITRIESASGQLVVGMVFATLALASTLLYINHEQGLGNVGYAFSALTLLILLLRGRG